MKLASRILLGLSVVAFISAACSSDKAVSPGGKNLRLLAGGGRLTDSDPYGGRIDSTTPLPPEPQPNPGFSVLFYSDLNCLGRPDQRVIRDSAEWQRWWDSAWVCLPGIFLDSTWWLSDSCVGGGVPGDSTAVDSLLPCDTCLWPAPQVNFDNDVVIVIALEEDSTYGRSLWIDEVTPAVLGTVVRYTVAKLGDDCGSILMRIMPMLPSSPTVAVKVARPVDDPIDWNRFDTVWSCLWEPDPSTPVTVYFTDTPCGLGPVEQVISDAATYEAWIAAAIACDSARWWSFLADSGYVGPAGIGFGLDVDFATHAVIILRAGPQPRWGGGIWLNQFETANGNTLIDYSVMSPDSACPPVEGLPEVNPTAAIRVPLPMGATVTWNRRTETIACLWSDSSGVVPGDSLK